MTEAIIYLTSASRLLTGGDKKIVDDLILKVSNESKSNDWVNRECKDISKKELGAWLSTLKKIIVSKFFNYLKLDWATREYYSCSCENGHSKDCLDAFEKHELEWEKEWDKRVGYKQLIHKTIEETEFGMLRDKYILLYRRCKWHDRTELETAFFEIIKQEIIEAYYKSNINFINKTKIDYESSK